MASKRHVKYVSQCKNKRKYATYEDAVPHARALHKRDSQWMNIYYCTYCNSYHVGHSGNLG